MIVGSGAAGAILAYELAPGGERAGARARRARGPARSSTTWRRTCCPTCIRTARSRSRGTCGSRFCRACASVGAPSSTTPSASRLPTGRARPLERTGGLNAGLDRNRLSDSYTPHSKVAVGEQAGRKRLHRRGPEIRRRGASRSTCTDQVAVVEANIVDCLGCGYCNIGCKFGKKLSMLDTVLPWAQQDVRRARSRSFPSATRSASRWTGRSGGRARASSGREGERARVGPSESVIVSAGAIASSLLAAAQQDRGMSVGRKEPGLQHGDAPDRCTSTSSSSSYDGLQISHYSGTSPRRAGYVLETWFNPPAHAVALHAGVESRTTTATWANTDQMACAGVVVGTQSNGDVRRGLFGQLRIQALARRTSRGL